ncbi:MAG: 16S rRNA (guanine(527)-N(7))-methyltransferase RsmG, partial [Chloroflexi bacterium]|nr:16S rRNA (guanine(527)-N(7))-methyltransferase RsmG [Chloroflexota bacterium]
MDEASSGPAPGAGRPSGAGWPTLAAGAKQAGCELTEHQVELFGRYLAGLSAWSGRANLVSASALADAERVLFLDSLALVPVLRREQPAAARLIDVGSGAGFPGLVLKLLLPELDVVLLEATRKKASFLTWMAEDLGLEGVQVRAERAEEAARDGALRDSFDVATARALGPLPVVLELARAEDTKTEETRLTIDDLLDADEVFLTNTIMQIMPVVRVEKRDIGTSKVGPITK